jgi:hypothetical protein
MPADRRSGRYGLDGFSYTARCTTVLNVIARSASCRTIRSRASTPLTGVRRNRRRPMAYLEKLRPWRAYFLDASTSGPMPGNLTSFRGAARRAATPPSRAAGR